MGIIGNPHPTSSACLSSIAPDCTRKMGKKETESANPKLLSNLIYRIIHKRSSANVQIRKRKDKPWAFLSHRASSLISGAIQSARWCSIIDASLGGPGIGRRSYPGGLLRRVWYLGPSKLEPARSAKMGEIQVNLHTRRRMA